MYLAGLLLATGASLALAGPASAAPSRCHHDGDGDVRVVVIHDGYDDDYGFPFGGGYHHYQSGSAYGLVNLFSGNGGNGLI
jgi:hypothetical protein